MVHNRGAPHRKEFNFMNKNKVFKERKKKFPFFVKIIAIFCCFFYKLCPISRVKDLIPNSQSEM